MPHTTDCHRPERNLSHGLCRATDGNLDSGQLRPTGTVSATGASNLSDLEDKLAEKAREQGAKGYVINSAGGNDQMFGTATI